MSSLCTSNLSIRRVNHYVATSVPHESHAMDFTTCSLAPSGPLKARRRGFWSGTWALRRCHRDFAKRFFETSTQSTQSTRLSPAAAMAAPPTAAATSCARPRSCEANSTFDLCDLFSTDRRSKRSVLYLNCIQS